jgi:hypothetical protein
MIYTISLTSYKTPSLSAILTRASPKISSELLKRVSNAAYTSLKQLAVSTLFIAASFSFLASPALLPTMVTMAVISAFLAGIVELVMNSKAVKDLISRLNPREKKPLEIATDLMPAYVFSATVDTSTRDILTHESGHALAANLLFKEAKTQIVINGYGQGSCSYFHSPTKLTQLGSWFGYTRSLAFISAAGPLASLFTSCVLMSCSHFLPNQHKKLKTHLDMMSLQSIVQNIFYSLSSFFLTPSNSHDFISIQRLSGIHPLICTSVIILVPLLIKTGLWLSTYNANQKMALAV